MLIRALHASELFKRPLLAAAMFRHRSLQFRERLQWSVVLDDQGLEFDQYDDLNPLYIIAEDNHGMHMGSLRLLPTIGRTMLAEHFSDLFPGGFVQDSKTWEMTRLCLSPDLRTRDALGRVPAALLYVMAFIADRQGVDTFLACCMDPMRRVFARWGVAGEVLGTKDDKAGLIFAARWRTLNHIQRLRCQVDENILDNIKVSSNIGCFENGHNYYNKLAHAC